jgi:hypothetical protein
MERGIEKMKNIILQHWIGEELDWVSICKNSIQKYANIINSDYEFFTGYPMDKYFPNSNKENRQYKCAQKIHILSEKYDEYDNVLLLDMDMLATKHIDNIFEYEGIGRLHKRGMSSAEGSLNGREWGYLYTKNFPMFFGNCIKLTKEERQTLRPILESAVENIIPNNSNKFPNDEIILHYLMQKTKILDNKSVLELPHSRFCDMPDLDKLDNPRVDTGLASTDATFLHFCRHRKDQIKTYKGVI